MSNKNIYTFFSAIDLMLFFSLINNPFYILYVLKSAFFSLVVSHDAGDCHL